MFYPQIGLRRQLSITFVIGVLCLVVVASLSTAYLVSERLRNDLVTIGKQATMDFSMRQGSRLALLYEAPDNAAEVAKAALDRPDVTSVKIYRHDRRRLFAMAASEATEDWEPDANAGADLWPAEGVRLSKETGLAMYFMAPVILQYDPVSEFATSGVTQQPQLLGYVQMVLQKKHLTEMQSYVFIDNIGVSLACAAILLLLLQYLITRITRPLQDLSDVMFRTGEGEVSARAQPAGPVDIREMGIVFNSMMDTLDERNHSLQDKNAALEREVYERGQAELAARHSTARLRSVIENVADGIITISEDGRIESINPAACSLFICDENIVGQDLRVLIPTDYREAQADYISAYLRTGKGTVVEGGPRVMRGLRRDGTEFPMEIAVSEMLLGERRLFIGILRDITQRRRTEQSLLEARDTAIEAARIKSEFLANMSHEIRTPLNGVLGMLELLRETPLDLEQRGYADTACRSGKTLLDMLNDTLDFSKIEAGRMTIDQIPFDLREVLESAMETVAPRVYAKGMELGCLFDLDLSVGLIGDPNRLRQVLLNLLGNAVKFTERGDIFVSVVKASESAEDVTLRFEVADSGCGIPSEAQARIFEAFTQADGSTTRRFGGTGLGLAICRQLVNLMGGEIGVLSEPGRGSVFWFTLRIAIGATPVAFTPDPRLTGLRALIAGNNTLQRMILQQLLASFGMQHALAVDADAALAQLLAAHTAGRPFDVVLFDTAHPDTQGKAFVQALAAHPELRDTHMVLTLPFGHSGMQATLAAARLQTGFAKPLRRKLLHDALVELMLPAMLRSVAGAPCATARRARLLIAEDHPVNQQVIAGMLRHLGHEFEIVSDGRAAFERLVRGGFDAVLMDCQMPGMDGYAATRAIRARESLEPGAHIPIVAMTASAMVEDRDKCLAAGMDAYLAKPVSPEALRLTLATWFGDVVAPTEMIAPPAVSSDAGGAELAFNVSMDCARLRAARDMLEDAFPDVVNMFLADAPVRIANMRAALARADAAAIHAMAHALKGSSVNLGAVRLAALCERCEKEAGADWMQAMPMRIAEITDEYAIVADVLTVELRAGKPVGRHGER